jgi:hypothetical protein
MHDLKRAYPRDIFPFVPGMFRGYDLDIEMELIGVDWPSLPEVQQDDITRLYFGSKSGYEDRMSLDNAYTIQKFETAAVEMGRAERRVGEYLSNHFTQEQRYSAAIWAARHRDRQFYEYTFDKGIRAIDRHIKGVERGDYWQASSQRAEQERAMTRTLRHNFGPSCMQERRRERERDRRRLEAGTRPKRTRQITDRS